MPEGITRLAPSPTGALHLGNARTFLINYLLARQRGWRVLMRVEDLEGPRVKPPAAAQLLDELSWLGVQWEEPIVYQSRRAAIYRGGLERLIEMGAVYPCTCSRKDIELAGAAPHADDRLAPYPGTCRHRRYTSHPEAPRATDRHIAWRVQVEDAPVAFCDAFAGDQNFNLAKTCGDFVVFRGENLAAYQLAVVLDDAAAGVDKIVRGDDLLESAARQMHLRELLGLTDEVSYYHVPLVVGQDGRRLAKRHGDTRLGHYRTRGVAPERLLGLMGFWCGLWGERREAEMRELLERFDIERLPREQVVFTEQDDRFLTPA